MHELIIKFVKNDYNPLLWIIILFAGLVRIISAVKMGWLAEDVFFIDHIDLWFSQNIFDYLFQLQHNIFPPRSPEFGTPPMGLWLQTIGVSMALRMNFSVLFGARIINVLLSLVTVYFSFQIGSKSFNKTTGYIAAFFVASSPSIVAIDSSAHVDTALAFFLVVSLYLFLLFLETGRRDQLMKSAVFLGLAGLTKIYAWLVSSVFSAVVFILFFLKKFKLTFSDVITFGVIIAVIPPLLWAGYRDFDHMERTLGVVARIGSLSSGVGTGGMFSEYDGVEGYSDKSVTYNFLMILGRSLPVVSVGVIMLLILLLVKFKSIPRKDFLILTLLLVIIICYCLGIHYLAGPKGVFNRVLFPSILFALVSSYFYAWLINKDLKNISTKYVVLAYLIITSIFPLISVGPHFYNAYNNYLIGGLKGGNIYYRNGHGEGLELAAEWINSNTPEGSFIYSPRAGFIEKYLVNRVVTYAPLNKNLEFAIAQGADYIVLHNTFFSGGLNPQIQKDLIDTPPVHNVITQSVPYIRIYRIEKANYFSIINSTSSAKFKKIGSSPGSSVSKIMNPNDNGIRYSIDKGGYAFIQFDTTVPSSASGIFININSGGDASNLYVDIGIEGRGYYRHTLKKRWIGPHEFFIPFSVMSEKLNPINIYDSNFVKVSVDSDKGKVNGSIIVNEIYFIQDRND